MNSVTGLSVDLCTATVTKRARMDDGSLGWRVVHDASGLAMPVRFLREVDAQMAMSAIAGMVDWSLSIDEIDELIDTRSVEQAMIRALAW